jgi:uncharacterized protein
VLRTGALFDLWKEAELVVKVAVSETWMNCPRYVHRYEKKAGSRYVPREKAEMPLCEWKRIDAVRQVTPARDRGSRPDYRRRMDRARAQR